MALKRIAFGVASLSAARVFQLASSFVAIPFLARMLTPTDFGLVALALSMVMFFTLIGDAGLGRSLVRVDANDTEAWSSAFWAVALLTLVLGACIFLLSWPAANFFNEPRLVPIMMTLALAPLLMGLAEIPAASLLQRERFQWLAAAEFVGALAGIIVALAVAFAGGGAWALVWQHLTQRIGKGAVVLGASRMRPRLVLNISRLKEHLGFMLDTSAWSLTMFFSRQADTLIVGKMLGAATLGLYNIAVRVMQLPVSIFGGSLHSAVYPRLVQVRDDNDALRRLVLFTTLAQALIVFPPIAAIAAASHAFFTLLLSQRWEASADIFTLLAGAAAIQTVVAINGSLLQAVGRTGARLRLTAEYAVLLALSALIAAQFGVHAVAFGCTLTTLIYLPRLLHLYLSPIACPTRDFLRVLATPTIVALTIFLGHRALIATVEMSDWVEIAAAVIETLVGYGVALWIERRRISKALRDLRALFALRGESAPTEPAPPERAAEHGSGVGDLLRVLAFGILRPAAAVLPRAWALALADLAGGCFAWSPAGMRMRRSMRAAFSTGARGASAIVAAWLRQPFRDYVVACRVISGRENPQDWVVDVRDAPAIITQPDQSFIIATGHFCREAMSSIYLPSVISKNLATVIAPIDASGGGVRQMRIRVQLGTMMEGIKCIRGGAIDVVEVKGASSAARMVAHLRQPGHAVVIAVDAPQPGEASGHQRPFAGHTQLTFAFGAARFARLTKRPILVAMPYLDEGGRMVLEWSDPIAPPESVDDEAAVLDAILDTFERAVGMRPGQYLLPIGDARQWNPVTQRWTSANEAGSSPERANPAPRRAARADS